MDPADAVGTRDPSIDASPRRRRIRSSLYYFDLKSHLSRENVLRYARIVLHYFFWASMLCSKSCGVFAIVKSIQRSARVSEAVKPCLEGRFGGGVDILERLSGSTVVPEGRVWGRRGF